MHNSLYSTQITLIKLNNNICVEISVLVTACKALTLSGTFAVNENEQAIVHNKNYRT